MTNSAVDKYLPETPYEPKYLIGKYYRTLEGKVVKIINDSRIKGYQCVKGDDGVWRYDRPGTYENGRVTGTPCYPPDPRNFADGAWLENSMYIIKLFNGFNPHTNKDNGTISGNITAINATKKACKELDRLQTKLLRLQAHYNGGRLDPVIYDILFR